MHSKQKSLWNRVNGIERIDISSQSGTVKDGEVVEFRNSKSMTVGAIILLLVVNCIFGYRLFASPNLTSKPPLVEICFFIFFLVGLLLFIKSYLNSHKAVIRLTPDAIEFGNKRVVWEEIKEVYLTKEPEQDSDGFYLIIEVNDKKHKFSLSWLESNHETIATEVGRFYYAVKNRSTSTKTQTFHN
jgi:hypothetical protein